MENADFISAEFAPAEMPDNDPLPPGWDTLSPGARRAILRARKWRASPGVAVIPGPLLLCADVPPAAKLLFAVLTTSLCSRPDGKCRASDRFLATLFDVSLVTAKRWVSALAALGFLDIEHDGNERLLVPRLVRRIPRKFERVFEKNGPSVKNETRQSAEKTPAGAQKCDAPGRTNDPQTRNVDKKRLRDPPIPKNVADTGGKTRKPNGENKQDEVAAIVALTLDANSEKRFAQLWDIAIQRPGAWGEAVAALQRAQAVGAVARPGAYFTAALRAILEPYGITIPGGSPAERRSVKQQIKQSFAAAENGGEP